jgi:hypothetical protein
MSDFLDEIRNTEDMLKGNINRMCVTNDIKELRDMCNHAKRRIQHIYDMNYDRLRKKGVIG